VGLVALFLGNLFLDYLRERFFMSNLLHAHKPRILIVDDERDLVRLVKYNVEQAGYEVYTAYNGAEALDLAWTKQPDLIVLDLMLPDCGGFQLCHEIKRALNPNRPKNPVRIIMLTARSAENDRVQGFESGADDYVTKPFSPRELVLRIKAMLNRAKDYGEEDVANKVLENGLIKMDLQAFRAWVGETEINLTPIEFKILQVLLKVPNTVTTREQLLYDVWEDAATDVLDRTVDAHVKRLRSKMGEARHMLETVRGIGYRLEASNA
jgi:two-component system phosphate regulon response regulator PhoB